MYIYIYIYIYWARDPCRDPGQWGGTRASGTLFPSSHPRLALGTHAPDRALAIPILVKVLVFLHPTATWV